MLEDTNFQSIDMFSPFVGAIADSSCGNIKSALVSKAFTKYREILHAADRRGLSIGLKEPEL